MQQDVRSALRWIARRPGLAFVSVASLGLGIGANLAVFSVIDAFLFRPFPVSEPERLVVVMSRTANGLRHVSAPDYFDFVESSSDRFALAARMPFTFSVRVGEVTERLEGELVSSNYFDVLGVPPALGRGFSADEHTALVPVVVISQSTRHDVYEVVGIVRDAKYRNLWEEPRPYLYFPLAQRFVQNMNLHVRTEGPPMAMLPAVRDVIRAIDDDLPLYNARPLSEQLAVLLASQRSVGLLFLLSGFIALTLSAVGTYGMAANVLASRRPELGLRMALGATAWDARRFVFDKGVKPLAAGLLLGLVASFALSRFVEDLLIGVSARDTVAFAAGVAAIAMSGIAACCVPALRASRIDPATALRSEY